MPLPSSPAGQDIRAPEDIAIGPGGAVYFSDFDGDHIFRIDSDGRVAIVAGTGVSGFAGDGGPARDAQFAEPAGLAFDAGGNLYVADHHNQRIRRIDTDGTITTIAGSGPTGKMAGHFSGDGGPATAATFSEPLGLAFDRAGNLYVGDLFDGRVRRIGRDGTIVTFDSHGAIDPARSLPGYLAFDTRGNLYVADRWSSALGGLDRIVRLPVRGTPVVVAGTGAAGFSGDGGPATKAELSDPNAIAFDDAGNLYFSDANNNRVRRIDTRGVVTTIAGTGVPGFAGDGGPATSAELDAPVGVAVDARGAIYVADQGNGRVRRIGSDGVITTVAGG